MQGYDRTKGRLGMTMAQDMVANRREELWQQASKLCNEAKKQLNEAHNKAKRNGFDKQAMKQLEEAHKEALKQTEKVRDAAFELATMRFRAVWDYASEKVGQGIPGVDEAAIRLDEAIIQIFKAFDSASTQADKAYKEAKKTASDKQAMKQLEEAHKEALKQTEKMRDAALDEALDVFRAVWEASQEKRG